jgi:hypothetical protein
VPQGCRVFVLQQAKRRGSLLRSLLSKCGYGITPSDGRETASRFFMNGPCVMLVDAAAGSSRRIDEAVRLARIAGIPIIAVGEKPGGPIPEAQHRLSGSCDDVALVAAVEVACYGHDHRGREEPSSVHVVVAEPVSDATH